MEQVFAAEVLDRNTQMMLVTGRQRGTRVPRGGR
jgi:hypothetical protein